MDLPTCLQPLPTGSTGSEMVRVGHVSTPRGYSGCTVVLFDRAVEYGVAAVGGGVSLRQTSAVLQAQSVTAANAVCIAGGSAYGLDSGGGVLRFLRERGRGVRVGRMFVPSVPTAAVFDLFFMEDDPPGPREGYEACASAVAEGVAEGRVGAGTTATVGKGLGIQDAWPGGVGLACARLLEGCGALVGVLVVVNAFGDVVDPSTGCVVAGASLGTRPSSPQTLRVALEGAAARPPQQNTTVLVVWTDAELSHTQCARVAWSAVQGLPRCIRPCFTPVDGDVAFAVSLGYTRRAREVGDLLQIGVAAAELTQLAVLRVVGGGDSTR